MTPTRRCSCQGKSETLGVPLEREEDMQSSGLDKLAAHAENLCVFGLPVFLRFAPKKDRARMKIN